jgi:hypothetical protein
LEQARESAETPQYATQIRPVEPLKPLTTKAEDIPVAVEGNDVAELVDEPFSELTGIFLPAPEPQVVAARYTIDLDEDLVSQPVEQIATPPRTVTPPGIETLLAALEQLEQPQPVDSPPSAPVVQEQVVQEQVVQQPVVQEQVVQEQVVQQPVVQQPVVQQPAAPRAAAPSAVEAELNRLAFVPDVEEEAGPVEVPTIAYSGQRVDADAGLPALSQHELYTARNSAPPAQSRLNLVDVATTFTPGRSRKKKNGFLRFVVFLLFIAMVGGAAYAGKYFLLDKRWEGDAKELASEVEATRGLTFDHPIKVETLTVDNYAIKLGSSAVGLTEENAAELAGEWRALGLLNGPMSMLQIGMAALPDSPAFYDATDETIYVADGMPPDLYRFGMHRALALALLDQEFGWSERVKHSAPSVVRGTRAFYDGDALATAIELTQGQERSDIVTQIFGLYGEYKIAASPAPFVTAVAGRLGVALRPYFESIPVEERSNVQKDVTITDGQALDLRRLVSGAVETAPAVSQGMLFWYHALASRIDQATAWEAALAWQSDDVSVVDSAGVQCVVAHLQVDPSALDAVTAALNEWAAAAPAASGTTITLMTTGSPMQLQINACDPGTGVPTSTSTGHLALGGAPLRAEQYHILVVAQPELKSTQAACAVFGGDPVSMADERGVIDNAAGWPAPASHPAPDPNRLGCAPATG